MNPFVVWLIVGGPLWATVGAIALPKRYRQRGLDTTQIGLAGGMGGMFLGAPGLAFAYRRTPAFARTGTLTLIACVGVAEFLTIFKWAYPTNVCLVGPGYVADQVQNGLALGLVYATMAVGLALIFSVQGIVSFAHGQFFLLGGVCAYLVSADVFRPNPLVILPIVAGVSFVLGAATERLLLSPLQSARIERPIEYALLVTFGLGLFLQYAIVGAFGFARGLRTDRYTDHPILGLASSTFIVGPLHIVTDLWVAGLTGLAALGVLAWFLRATWTGLSLRAVAMQRQAATVLGIHVGRAFTLAFAIGTMLAGVAGAILIPVINFPIPQIAVQAGAVSYVVIVLGGLGSVWGALAGGLIVGVAQALGAGCFPDASRGATYETAFGLGIFAVVLLLRPRGLFGKAY